MNRLVAQAFQPAGLPDFRVRWTRNGRLESRPDPQARKPALRTRLGSGSQCAPNMTWRLSMNRCSVAQVANLLYRRLLIGEALGRQTASGLATRDTVDTAVCATAEAQHDAVPEAAAPVRFMVPMRAKVAGGVSMHRGWFGVQP